MEYSKNCFFINLNSKYTRKQFVRLSQKIIEEAAFTGLATDLCLQANEMFRLHCWPARNLTKPEDLHLCFEGVWIEMFWGDTDHAGANSLGWTLEKPLTPCINAKLDEQSDCFIYAHLGYLRVHPRDYAGVIALCTQNNLNNVSTRFCLKGVGITMMKHFTSTHLEETEALIAALSYGEKHVYYQGVIGYARLSNVSEKDLRIFCTMLKNDSVVCRTVLKNDT